MYKSIFFRRGQVVDQNINFVAHEVTGSISRQRAGFLLKYDVKSLVQVDQTNLTLH